MVFAGIYDLAIWSRFAGYGPMPGMVHAEVEGGGALGLGARVRGTNSDGSVHHEIVDVFEPSQVYAIHMDVTSSPAGRVFANIEEKLTFEATALGGTRIVRSFRTTLRAWYLAPTAWIVTHGLLAPVVRRHDRAVAAVVGDPDVGIEPALPPP